jgi:hypothetical protein
MMGRPGETLFLSSPLCPFETAPLIHKQHYKFGIAHLTWRFYRAGTTEKTAQADCAMVEKSKEASATAPETKGFLDDVHKRFDHSLSIPTKENQ